MLSETETRIQEKEEKDILLLDQFSMENLCSAWVNYKGAWITIILLILGLRAFFGIIPRISSEIGWTLTNLTFNVGSFIMFHVVRGIPFDSNQGAYDELTLWEQIDNMQEYTPSKKFFMLVHVCLFFLSTHYTHYDIFTFLFNFGVLLVVLIVKLPEHHRIFVKSYLTIS
ncbi:uncharacterized protein VTP21DRAFT_525 [Calcarisporiella thermophila]|uniref:uncharacterized protein n=1 Tax=Calcarisporiella thermophila TaxID=911321 RepID=UPI00374231B4